MNKRGVLMFLSVLVLAIALGPIAAAEEAASNATPNATYDPHSRPPKNLKKMPDGHWTPWDPPTPPEGAKVHNIVKGDTLWGLSGQYLGNPYLWPQIWDQNRYVLDSHWIYPGDPIIVPAPEVVPIEPPQSPPPTPQADNQGRMQEMPPASTPPSAPIYHLGDYQDAYCVAYVQNEAVHGPTIVAPDEEEMIGIGQGHVVYLNAGSSEGMKPGDHFTIVRDSGELKHPVTHKKVGHRVDWRGQLTLIAVQEHTSTAEITFSCEDILRGDRIIPYKEVSVPTTMSRPMNQMQNRYTNMGSGKSAGYVILSRDTQIALGQGNIVGVDLGPSEVKAGDMLTIFRASKNGDDLPRVNLGEGIVLRTEGQSAIVRISAAVKEIYVGDRAEVR